MENPRESLFISTIRAFCKAFSIMVGIFIAFIPIMLIVSLFFRSDYDLRNKTTLNVLPDLNDEVRFAAEQSPVILQININSIIGTPKLNTLTIKDQLVDSRRGLFKGDRVKGILLYINSPGGSAIDSDNIYRMLKDYKAKYKVPVVAYVEGLCASGGMYIACAADKIYSSPVGIIGSVGVVNGPFLNFYEALKKIGVSSETITAGKDKDMFNPMRQWSPNEGAAIKKIIDHLYQRFVMIVTENRPEISKQELVDVYGANIFDAEEAQKLGYVDDGNSNYQSAVLGLMQAANMNPQHAYQIIHLEPKKSIFDEIVKAESHLLTGKIKHSISLNDSGLTPLQEQFAYLYLPSSSQ